MGCGRGVVQRREGMNARGVATRSITFESFQLLFQIKKHGLLHVSRRRGAATGVCSDDIVNGSAELTAAA